MQIDVYSQIGFVMLIGLAAKNAILIVEFARRRREEGLSIVEAAMEAARLRLRPILMTAFAFILGVRAADGRDRRRRGEPAVDRHHGLRRHGRGDHPDPALRAGLLRRDRATARAPRRANPPESRRYRQTAEHALGPLAEAAE